MTAKEKKLALAYAIGRVTCGTDAAEHKEIKLGEINDEWKDYSITGFGGITCKDYNLRYENAFGDQLISSRMITLYYGWSIGHMVHMIDQAIMCHKAELAKAEKTTEET